MLIAFLIRSSSPLQGSQGGQKAAQSGSLGLAQSISHRQLPTARWGNAEAEAGLSPLSCPLSTISVRPGRSPLASLSLSFLVCTTGLRMVPLGGGKDQGGYVRSLALLAGTSLHLSPLSGTSQLSRRGHTIITACGCDWALSGRRQAVQTGNRERGIQKVRQLPGFLCPLGPGELHD